MNKKDEEIEEILASILSRQIFHYLAKTEEYFNEKIVDCFNIVLPNQTSRSRFLAKKSINEFFDEMGKFSIEKSDKMKNHSIEAILNNSTKIYDLPWNNAEEVYENKTIMSTLYASTRLEKLKNSI
ncbi:unnamed protein product [Rotaria sp. Silwood1]|nr:unnamed protein product [Rotaria sp. Silwood1]CAF1652260.1 unnamed protein product [Rotaria sp. Silwood1]CAF3867913.1 unnamed protein product [Rotaria sp. Silwood1]CAF3937268.1 unnamed protein product [Rotaria sp. Silwood1]CAF4888194.1 unnamed protein product [Rotaria sp. Silwood1]